MINPKTVLSKFKNYLEVHQVSGLFNKYNHLDKNRIVYVLRHHEESQCRNYFANIMSAICNDDNLKKQFVDKLPNGMIILRLQKLIDLFNLHNYQTDSLTRYDQTIGLKDDQGYIKDSDNVVLSFPYKDTVLQGSMSTPEDNIKKRFLNKVINQPEINELKEPKIMYHVTYFDKNNLRGTSNFNTFNPEKDSLFIKGNNLEALYSLLPIYKNKVKLIYIDPPFDTDSKEFGYNDNFGQATWLTFMKNRLEIARKFLRSDGLIFVNIDKNESAYLKVLMDEIFKEENFISTIFLKSSDINSTKMGNKDKTIIDNSNQVHVYARDASYIRKIHGIKPQYTPKSKWDPNYNKVVSPSSSKGYVFLSQVLNKKFHKPKFSNIYKQMKQLYKNNGKSMENIKETSIEIKKLKDIERGKKERKFISDNRNKIFRKAPSISKGLKELSNNNKGKIVSLSNKYHTKKAYALNGKAIAFLANNYHPVDGYKREKLSTVIGNIWTDITFDTLHYEGAPYVKFQNGQKPEQLLHRIIDMTTKPNDIVLDFFAGSATTQAVAMKMHRRFIGVEQLNYPVKDFLQKGQKTGWKKHTTDDTPIYIRRLENVISGSDTHGVSNGKYNDVNWHGGGSFYYAKMMPYNMKYIDKLIINRDDSKGLNAIAKDIFSNARLIATAQLLHADRYYWKNEIGKGAKDKFKYLFNILDSNLDYYNYNNIDDENVRGLLNNKDYQFNKDLYRNISRKVIH